MQKKKKLFIKYSLFLFIPCVILTETHFQVFSIFLPNLFIPQDKSVLQAVIVSCHFRRVKQGRAEKKKPEILLIRTVQVPPTI